MFLKDDREGKKSSRKTDNVLFLRASEGREKEGGGGRGVRPFVSFILEGGACRRWGGGEEKRGGKGNNHATMAVFMFEFLQEKRNAKTT